MREILFRGKRVDNGEWVEGDSLIHSMYKKGDVCIGDINELWIYSINEETIGQYTGLKDENGNKIFEGDIVKFNEDSGVFEFNTKNVASCGCCYEFFTGTGFRAENICLHSCEIIGNIYDNPELLKEDE